ncbi:MAG TPA: TadG family pilus assembly protein [Geomonas sp.]|nr:TadG family pilus assembly protein [Geomonas sp.]
MVLVLVALLMVVLLGLVGLVVDGGHLQVVRGELQNDADASALAGAVALFPSSGGSGGVLNPQWNDARKAANDFIAKNSSDSGKTPLRDGDVSVGYWNLAWTGDHELTPSTTLASDLTANDVPAVRVKVARADGSNGGEVPTFFMKVLGTNSAAVSSKASVAMRGYAGSAPAGLLFPMALSSCMTTQYFNQNPLPSPPTEIKISTPYLPGGAGCYTGQWTSFTTNSNSDKTIQDYLKNPSTVPAISDGDKIFIQNGAEANLYNIASSYVGKDVIMAIVDSLGKADTGSQMPVIGFATFHITGSDNQTKQITGYFVRFDTTLSGSSSGGTPSNLVAQFPQLVQ